MHWAHSAGSSLCFFVPSSDRTLKFWGATSYRSNQTSSIIQIFMPFRICPVAIYKIRWPIYSSRVCLLGTIWPPPLCSIHQQYVHWSTWCMPLCSIVSKSLMHSFDYLVGLLESHHNVVTLSMYLLSMVLPSLVVLPQLARILIFISASGLLPSKWVSQNGESLEYHHDFVIAQRLHQSCHSRDQGNAFCQIRFEPLH